MIFNHITHKAGKIMTLVELSRFGCMATGGILAYAYFKQKELFLKFALRKDVRITVIAFIAALLIWGFSNRIVLPFLAISGLWVYLFARAEKFRRHQLYLAIPVILICLFVLTLTGNFKFEVFDLYKHELISIPFAFLILNISIRPEKFRILKHPVMQYLGRISYGVYMYHNIMITISVRVLVAIFPAPGSLTGHVLHYIIAFALTIGCSALSYALLEKPFLKMKKRFTKIRSGAKG